jgi:ABC-2 type transport system ATP-binding protein
MNAIEISHLSKTFRGKKRSRVEALKEVSLTIGVGEVLGFLGPNGAGKSTTIKVLTGQIRPTSGSVSILGETVINGAAHHKVGYLPENPSFYDFLTAREYLRFVGRAFEMEASAVVSSSEQVLQKLGLEHAADRPIRGFSKGMVQRLGLAQSLLHDPDIFILDEPMSGLDPMGRSLVKKIILELKELGKTVFFSTHITADVEEVCDRVAVLANGELRAERVVSDLLQAGVVGYYVVLEQQAPASVRAFLTEQSSDNKSLYVPRAQFNDFMRRIDAVGGTIDVIETRRRGLEDFFLDAIA